MKINFKKLFSVSFATLAFAVNVSAQTAQEGFNLLDSEKYSKAKSVFENLAKSASTPENQFNLGYYHLNSPSMDLKAATDAFNQATTIDPKGYLGKIGLGAVKLSQKDNGGAKMIFDEVLKSTKSKNADVLLKIADAYTMLEGNNDPAEALRLLDLIPDTKKFAPTVKYYLTRGKVFYIKNDGGSAMSEYEKALLLDPKSAAIKSLMGQVWVQGKQYQKALDNYNSAIASDPNFAPVYRQMGNLYVTYKRYPLAAENFKKYNELADTDDEAKLRYAKLAFSSQDFDNALVVLEELKPRAKDAIVDRLIGMALIEKGKPADGIAKIKDFLSKADASRVLGIDYGYIGRGYAKIDDAANKVGNDSLAIVNMEKAIELKDTSYNYLADMANIYMKGKKFSNAAGVYKRILDATAKPTVTEHFNLANAYTGGKDFVNAKASWEKVTEMSPKWPSGFYGIANATRSMDTTATKASSIPYFKKFIEILELPENLSKITDAQKRQAATAYTYIASLAGNSNDTEGAKVAFIKALSYDPNNKYAKERLEQINNAAATATIPPTPPAGGTVPQNIPK